MSFKFVLKVKKRTCSDHQYHRKGERALDIGSGEGTNVFIAASKVGPTGQAIGIDSSNVSGNIPVHSIEKFG